MGQQVMPTFQGRLIAIKNSLRRIYDARIEELYNKQDIEGRLQATQGFRDWLDDVMSCLIDADFSHPTIDQKGHVGKLIDQNNLQFAVKLHANHINTAALENLPEDEGLQEALRYASHELAGRRFETLSAAKKIIPNDHDQYAILAEAIRLDANLLFISKKQYVDGAMTRHEYDAQLGNVLSSLEEKLKEYPEFTPDEERKFIRDQHLIPGKYMQIIEYTRQLTHQSNPSLN